MRQKEIDIGFAGPRFAVVHPDDCPSVGSADVVVVGGGVAGLCAALEAAKSCSVLVVSKGPVEESNTRYAQGGIAAVLGADDSFAEHVRDTIEAGAYLCHEKVVREIVEQAPAAIDRVVQMGGRFDLSGGKIALSREGGHSKGRIVHARGDATGLELQTVLTARARAEAKIRILEQTFAIDLVTAGGAIAGVIVLPPSGQFTMIRCRAVILAAGGAGQVYRETTNPSVATGDGLAMAFRAGAELRGMEFFQFHPTTLYVAGLPRLLISETVRGEGGILRDRDGVRFMPEAHPQAELAPRDIVSRAIVRRIIQTGDASVYLDVTHVDPDRFRARFPGITRLLDQYGIDYSREPIPVHPAAHYMIGGIVADVDGRTSIPGLFAAGEVSSTGLHGANRLGSNSLLEGLVCGLRAGHLAAECPAPTQAPFDGGNCPEEGPPPNLDRNDLWASLRALLWKRVGIERDARNLSLANERLAQWSVLLFRTQFVDRSGLELLNALTMGRLMASAALQRLESRGTHFRADYPSRNDAEWLCDLTLRRRAD